MKLLHQSSIGRVVSINLAVLLFVSFPVHAMQTNDLEPRITRPNPNKFEYQPIPEKTECTLEMAEKPIEVIPREHVETVAREVEGKVLGTTLGYGALSAISIIFFVLLFSMQGITFSQPSFNDYSRSFPSDPDISIDCYEHQDWIKTFEWQELYGRNCSLGLLNGTIPCYQRCVYPSEPGGVNIGIAMLSFLGIGVSLMTFGICALQHRETPQMIKKLLSNKA